jgi:branched-subunit amino acid ABC-type transport system permease component
LWGMVFTDQQLKIIGLNVAIVLGLQLLLKKTKLGKAIRATSADPELARNCGIRTRLVGDVTSIVAGSLCGLGGVILAINIVTFNFTTGAEFLVLLISAAVLGGIGHPVGAVVGAVIIGVASELTSALVDPSYNLTVAFIFLGLVLLFRPQGIFSDIAERKNVIT